MDFKEIPNSGMAAQGNVRPRRNMRFIVIAGLIMCVAIASIIVLIRRSDSDNQEKEALMEMIDVACETEGCALILTSEKAAESRNVGICDAVLSQGDLYEECVREYAYSLLDASACEALRGESEQQCTDSVYYAQALQAQDISSCAEIRNDDTRRTCGFDLLSVYVQEDNCPSTGEFRSACEEAISRRREIGAQIGPALCDPYAGLDENDSESEEYAICMEVLDTLDLDGDGLVIREEIERGTDNQNPDTDGDGFDDGTEVRNGYNPLGE